MIFSRKIDAANATHLANKDNVTHYESSTSVSFLILFTVQKYVQYSYRGSRPVVTIRQSTGNAMVEIVNFLIHICDTRFNVAWIADITRAREYPQVTFEKAAQKINCNYKTNQ